MAERKITGWFTMNGKHVPIYEGESKKDAVNRAVANSNEDTKEKQIAKAKEQADKLNGKEPNLRTESGMAQKMYGKSFSELSEEQKDKVTDAVIKYKENGEKPSTMQKNAESLGLDYKAEGKKLIKEYEAKKEELKNLPDGDKKNELNKWLKQREKAYNEYKEKLKDNEDIKQEQIAKNKAVADKLNGKSEPTKSQSQKLEDRLKGDDLENAKDFIEELKANSAEVDDNGYVTLYHHTTGSSADEIRKSGIMKAKEDGIFFTTKKDSDAQAGGRGDAVLKFSIPVEKLTIDDEFGDEVHVRIPLKSKNSSLDVSKYLR